MSLTPRRANSSGSARPTLGARAKDRCLIHRQDGCSERAPRDAWASRAWRALVAGLVDANPLADANDQLVPGPDMRRIRPNGEPLVVVTIKEIQ